MNEIPALVYVLLQSGTVLGVLSTEQRALDEAHSLMHAYGGMWEEVIPKRYWQGKVVTVEVNPHEVR